MLEFIMKKVIVNWVFAVVLFLIELHGKHHRYNIFSFVKLFHLLTELPVLMWTHACHQSS